MAADFSYLLKFDKIFLTFETKVNLNDCWVDILIAYSSLNTVSYLCLKIVPNCALHSQLVIVLFEYLREVINPDCKVTQLNTLVVKLFGEVSCDILHDAQENAQKNYSQNVDGDCHS